MNILLTIVFFLILLSFLVIIHEAGHFLAAKLFGVKVYEFGLGYPPKVKTLFKKWHTEFTLNWMPFGGFVRLAGEERSVDSKKKLSAQQKKQLFYTKPAWQRLIIILSGAAVNFVFGIFAFSTMFTFIGIPETSGIIINEVMEGTPASEAGLETDVSIVAVESSEGRIVLNDVDDFIDEVSKSAGETVDLVWRGEEGEVVSSVYVRNKSEIPEGQGSIGVVISPENFEFVKYPWYEMPWRGAVFGTQESIRFGFEILLALEDMGKQLFTAGNVPDEVGGPVRIVYEAQKANLLSEGPLAILNFAAILSINLAIVNVLPIPALDGGRALFILIEAVMGDKFKPEYEQYGNAVGMLLLLGLIILISFRDVGLIFADNGIGFQRILTFFTQ